MERDEFENEREILDQVRPTIRVVASDHFKERVMKAINEDARPKFKMGWPKWAAIGAAAALLLILPALNFGPKADNSKPGAALFAQSIEAMSAVKNVHIIGRMRSIPGDNFELIGAQYDFVPIEMWREFSNPPRWRVDKPGRTVLMDGQSSVLYIAKTNSAMRGDKGAGFIEWLRPLLDPQSIMEKELAAARGGKAETRTSEANGFTTVSARRKPGGDFTNNWALNKSIAGSDHTAIYRFDAATKLLTSIEVRMLVDGSQVTVAEFSAIRYNEALPADVFKLELPADVDWMVSADEKKAPSVTLDSPRAAASYFLDALAREDWDSALEVSQGTRVSDIVKRAYGGMQVISLGEPFKSGLYPGYFVPYEIRLKNGYVKKHNLAVRNDNKAHRWMMDGGY